MPATVALTFDQSVTACTVAKDILAARGMVATFYCEPGVVGVAGEITKSQMILLKYLGWEIGAYTGSNMVTMVTSNRDQAFDKLKSLSVDMAALGFEVETIAPNQRAWNGGLADMCRGRFKGVRVVDDFSAVQSYPIPDPLWVKKGGTASWSSGDTVASLSAQLDSLIASGGLWVPVIHNVGSSPNGLTVSTDVFAGFMDYLKTKRDSGLVRVVRFVDALSPP